MKVTKKRLKELIKEEVLREEKQTSGQIEVLGKALREKLGAENLLAEVLKRLNGDDVISVLRFIAEQNQGAK